MCISAKAPKIKPPPPPPKEEDAIASAERARDRLRAQAQETGAASNVLTGSLGDEEFGDARRRRRVTLLGTGGTGQRAA